MVNTNNQSNERGSFINDVSNEDKLYAFTTVGYLTINTELTNTLSVVLSPAEVREIRDWFFQRNRKWISYVPFEFRSHSQELYDKLYQAEVDRTNMCDPDENTEELFEQVVYDPNIDPMDEECPWMLLHWPEELFNEMGIDVPNAAIWVSNKTINERNGRGYPIFLEDNYLDELRAILVETVWNDSCQNSFINIETFRARHESLCQTIKERLTDMLINTYDYPLSILQDLSFSIFQESIELRENPLFKKRQNEL